MHVGKVCIPVKSSHMFPACIAVHDQFMSECLSDAALGQWQPSLDAHALSVINIPLEGYNKIIIKHKNVEKSYKNSTHFVPHNLIYYVLSGQLIILTCIPWPPTQVFTIRQCAVLRDRRSYSRGLVEDLWAVLSIEASFQQIIQVLERGRRAASTCLSFLDEADCGASLRRGCGGGGRVEQGQEQWGLSGGSQLMGESGMDLLSLTMLLDLLPSTSSIFETFLYPLALHPDSSFSTPRPTCSLPCLSPPNPLSLPQSMSILCVQISPSCRSLAWNSLTSGQVCARLCRGWVWARVRVQEGCVLGRDLF